MSSIETLRTDTEPSVLGQRTLSSRVREGVLQGVAVYADLEGFVHGADRLPRRPRHGHGGRRAHAAELRAAVPGQEEREVRRGEER